MPAGDAAWIENGLRVGAALIDAHLVLVLGDDARTTALTALGVARSQSSRRRVALGDLLGDAEPIQQLLEGDDPHGLTDSFLYGVSLNKIARAVPQYGELYVLPTGSEVPEYAEIFTNARWRRLAAGFRETGSLLVVAAPANAEHVADVADLTDGVILVGNVNVPGVEGAKLVGRVTAQEAQPAESISGAGVLPNEPGADVETPDIASRRRPWFTPAAIGGAALALVLAVLGIWFAARPLVRGHYPVSDRRSTSSSAAGSLPSPLDSIRPESTASGATPALAPANPADSANAAAYAVVVARFNTLLGAQKWLQTQARDLPSPTFAPFRVNDETWYRAIVGSYPTRAQADSLLEALSAKGLTRPDSANVIRAPFAFLVDSVTADAVPAMLKYFASIGQPIYALRQQDGSARVYGGAFESPAEAALYLENFPSGGNFKTVFVYRIGRVY